MKKKILSFVLAFCLILPAFLIFTSCSNAQNYDQLVIKNWESYSQICAGFVNENVYNSPRTLSTSVVYAASNVKTPKLIGLKNDGSYEPIVFVDDENKDVKQDLYLHTFRPFNNFTFLKYSTTRPYEISKGFQINSSNRNACSNYILSHKTGKIYEFNQDVILEATGYWDETENAFYAGSNRKIIKIYEQNEQLVIEDIFNMATLSSSFYFFYVDKYGNIFSSNKKYIIKTNKTIELLSIKGSDMYQGMNGIVYYGNKCFDENGDLVDASFVPSSRLNFTINYDPTRNYEDYLIKRSGNISYYYCEDDKYLGLKSSMFFGDKVFKVTFIDDVQYTIQEILLEYYVRGQKGLFANDKLYYRSLSEVFYVDIENGQKTTLTSNYIFNAIWSDNKGNICFSAIDNNMQVIEGVIKPDDSIDITVTPSIFEIQYFSPIN